MLFKVLVVVVLVAIVVLVILNPPGCWGKCSCDSSNPGGGGKLYSRPSLPLSSLMLPCNCHLTLSLCIFINVDIIFTFRSVILLPFLIPFFSFDLPFLYFYLYTSYYLVCGTFICIANFFYSCYKSLTLNWILWNVSCEVSAKLIHSTIYMFHYGCFVESLWPLGLL